MAMAIEEAISHAREVSKRDTVCEECRQEHAQLADWLEELKMLRTAITPPNEPLTPEQLRKMDGQPVWVEFEDRSVGLWGIVHISVFEQIVFPDGLHCTIGQPYYGKIYKAYAYPPAHIDMEAWGFAYKTAAFVWAKRNRRSTGWFWGLGNWTRSNAEVCLLATKGRPERVSASVHSLICSPVGKHSAKPNEARKRIVELMGDVPRIELFARERVPGWDAWGDEV